MTGLRGASIALTCFFLFSPSNIADVTVIISSVALTLSHEKGFTVSKEHNQSAYRDKLEEIRDRLLGTPSPEELQGLQLQLEVLQRWAQLSRVADEPYHNHDHQNTDHNDHDHAIVFEAAFLPVE